MLRPIGCVAPPPMRIAAKPCWFVVAHETLGQFLTRLDRAIEKALNEDIFTDEINPQHSNRKRPLPHFAES